MRWEAIVGTAIEEVVHRGIFVVLFSQIVSLPVAILFGWGVFALTHLYQSPQFILRGVLFFTFVVGLSLSPLGLIAAMGLHAANNLIYCESISRNLQTETN